jgi:hypothetical protein
MKGLVFSSRIVSGLAMDRFGIYGILYKAHQIKLIPDLSPLIKTLEKDSARMKEIRIGPVKIICSFRRPAISFIKDLQLPFTFSSQFLRFSY